MTKRALSLLLTLVMVLSLCVPALAAEDFEAEAPAEVVEEAPEAPDAPVEPEAEEPADEPVVDEPAAEEPVEAVADEPEMASVMPEDAEDLPYLVALGKVSKLNHWKLETLLAKVEPYKTKVDAGELYVQSSYTKFDQTTSPAKAFLDEYEKAHKCLDAINGEVVDIDVTDATITTVINNLKTYISEEDGGTAGTQYLTDKLTTATGTADTAMTTAKLYAELNVGKSYTGDAMYRPNGTETYPSTWTINDKTDFDGEDFKAAYSSTYLTALKNAQTEIKAFDKLGKDAKYKDFAAVRATVLAAAKLEEPATWPESGDATTLDNAIKAAKAVKDTYKTGSTVNSIYAAGNPDLYDKVVPQAEGLQNVTLGLNGLKTNVRYYDVHKAVKDLTDALITKSNTFQVEKYKATAAGNIEVTVSVAKIGDNAETNIDGNDYGYAYQVGDWWQDKTNSTSNTGDTKDYTADGCIIDITNNGTTWTTDADYPGRWVAKINVIPTDDPTHTGDAIKTTFSNSDVIKISFYVKDVNTTSTGAAYSAAFKTETLTFPKDAYFGAIIKKAWVEDYGTSSVTTPFKFDTLAKLNNDTANNGGAVPNSQAGNDIKIYVQMDKSMGSESSNYPNLSFQVFNSAGKSVLTNEVSALQTANAFDQNNNIWYLTATDDTDPYVVAGDMSVQKIEVTKDAATSKITGVISRSSATVTINPLSKWGSVKEVQKALDAAKKLVKADYVLDLPAGKTSIAGRPDIKTIDDAINTINNDIKLIEDAITSTTVANTKNNRVAVLGILQDIGEVYGYLKPNAVNIQALNTLMVEVAAMKDDDYTYDSWGKMQDAYADAGKVLAHNPLIQSEIDKAYADLKAAQDALVKEGEVDKTALTAAIASAKALKEEDYTKESWAANKDAIDAAVTAAQAVVDNATATQAQVNAALNSLTAAVGKLEKVGGEDEPPAEGPKAPASGTGWTLYNDEWYFFKNGTMVKNYWVGQADGASQWSTNWYYVGSDGKMATGMQYIDDLHGGYGWYFLQPTNTKGEIGKMLTGWQWVGGQYGECYFSKANGSSGKCTWSELMGNWNTSTNSWSK